MPGPALILVGPLLLALLLFLTRRWPRPSAVIGVAGLLLLRWLLLGIVLAEGSNTRGLFQGVEWVVLGRSLTLTEPLQALLAFIYLAAALVFVLAQMVVQGRLFYTASVALLSPLAAALLIQPSVFGLLMLVVAAAGVAVLIQDGQPGSTLASFRYLKMMVLAIPLLLLAGWLAEENLVTHFGAVWQLLLVGLLIMLAGFPFHIWVIPVWEQARPMVPVVVFGLVQLFLVGFARQYLSELPSIQRNAQFLQLLQMSGAMTVFFAGFLAWTAQSAERLIGYLLLVDMGATVFSLGLGGQSDPATTYLIVISRLVALAFAGLGLAVWRGRLPADRDGSLSHSLTHGLGRRWPWVALLVIYGGLSLIGLPLTPGFAGRWLMVTMAGGQDGWLVFLILVGMGAAAAGVARCMVNLFAQADPLIDQTPEQVAALPRWQTIAIWLLLAFGAFLTLAPQWLMRLAEQMAAVF